MNMKVLYLLLAVVGAIVPYIFLAQHFGTAGYGVKTFVDAIFATPAAGGFTTDVLISSLVFWIAMFARRSRGKGPNPALFIALNLLIGLSCALPAYLYADERMRGAAPQRG